MMGYIICIGNRFVAQDAAGPAVFDRLQQMQTLPEDVELIDGGLMGLNLLPFLERGGRVVFVDAVSGFDQPGEIVVLDWRQILENTHVSAFDHDAGLAYLLTVLPRVCDGEMPREVILVGLEEASPVLIERAAELSLKLAKQGLKGRD